MKLLFTHERFMPDFGGGGELIVYDRVRSMREHGADVRVLVAGEPSISEYEGIPTRRIGVPRHAMNLAVGRILREARGVDLIHTFTYNAALPSMIAARILGIPIVCEFLGFFGDEWTAMKGRLIGRAYRAWERMLLRLPWNRAIFLSDFSHADAIEMGLRRERCATLEPAVDSERFKPATKKDDYVLFVGKFERRKGIDDLIAVAHALPHIEFWAVGWTENFERLHPHLSPNLHFQSLPRGPAVFDAFARAPIFFFPTRKETFGLVVREAMAAGCAIVSTSELEFSGRRVAAGDVEGMTEAVETLWQDRTLTAQLGRENREMAMHHNREATLAQQLAIYSAVLSESRGDLKVAERPSHPPSTTF